MDELEEELTSEMADPWQDFPLEMACDIISNITDIHDISKLLRTSSSFLGYVYCIQHLTSDVIVSIPMSYFRMMNELKTIDHKIEIIVEDTDLNFLSRLNLLREAHFVVQDLNLLANLLQVLDGLNNTLYYFKISLVLPTMTVGILIRDDRYLIIPLNNEYKDEIYQIISDIRPSLNEIIVPKYNTGEGVNKYNLFRNPMRDFLGSADFGLMNPTQPPSDNNPPLSNYVKLIAGGTSRLTLIDLLFIYFHYHQLISIMPHTIGIKRIYNADQTMRKCFKNQIEKETKINMSVMRPLDISKICNINELRSVTPDEIAEYQFPRILTIQEQEIISSTVRRIHRIYEPIRPRGQPPPVVNYYTTDGSLRSYQIS